jgi:N-acylneuraminate cytidylyltransferase
MHKRTVVIIPARGGSKRLPKKNIIEFHGKPMIAWAIESAKEALNADVYVSTDYEDIAEIARMHGSKVIMRRSGSDDKTTVQVATIITLQQIKDELGIEYDHVVQLMACCPLRTADDVKKAYENFCYSGYDFQLSCYNDTLAHWDVRFKDKYRPEALEPEALKTRSQDLEELYRVTGAIWIANVSELIKQGTFYGKDYTFFPIDELHAIDIDDSKDLMIARAIKYAMEGENA